MKNKKGMAWISWILLLLFFVTLSVLVYNWSTEQIESLTEITSEYVEGGLACSDVVFDVQIMGTNQIQVTNYGVRTIDAVFIRYDGTDSLKIQNSEILVNQGKKTLNIPPYNNNLEVIPMLEVDKNWVICPEKKLVFP
ncbi:MAG: hypothetical protein ABIF40_00780 [archaeon]